MQKVHRLVLSPAAASTAIVPSHRPRSGAPPRP